MNINLRAGSKKFHRSRSLDRLSNWMEWKRFVGTCLIFLPYCGKSIHCKPNVIMWVRFIGKFWTIWAVVYRTSRFNVCRATSTQCQSTFPRPPIRTACRPDDSQFCKFSDVIWHAKLPCTGQVHADAVCHVMPFCLVSRTRSNLSIDEVHPLNCFLTVRLCHACSPTDRQKIIVRRCLGLSCHYSCRIWTIGERR
jgi:hypothetical protein